MVHSGRPSLSLIYTGILLAVVLLPEFLGAVPVGPQEQGEDAAVSSDVKSHAMANLKKLVRNTRSLPQFKRLPDFWGWYKYFMETGNQEGVEDLDRMYMTYLQNKHKSEEGPTFNHYLTHLSEIYKSCADSDDPECIAESTSKPKAKLVMPAAIKEAPVRLCHPYYDPYCLFPVVPKTAEPAPAPAKVPAPMLTPMLPIPMKTPTGFYYYAPILEPFLSAEQKTELLRICNPSDVECLQYHLRAAYGYRPASGPAPSYSALGCDPAKDPYCRPLLVHKAPTGYYHLYPSCNPEVDPLCAANVAAPPAAAAASDEAPKEQHCNPLFDEGCNPLTATKLSSLTKPVLEFAPKDEPAPPAPAPLLPALAPCDPTYDPFCLLRAAAALRQPPKLLPQYEVRSRLGVRGKTKDGHDCYIHYDEGCVAVEASDEPQAAAPVSRRLLPFNPPPPAAPACHPFDPTCGKFAAPPAALSRNGVIEPHPDCDPEVDYSCRLRRANPASAAADEPAQKEEPSQAAVDPRPFAGYAAPQYAGPRFEDFLRGYMSQYKKK